MKRVLLVSFLVALEISQAHEILTPRYGIQPLIELDTDDTITSAHFSPDSSKIVTTSIKNVVTIFDAYTGNKLTTLIKDGRESQAIGVPDTTELTHARFSPNGKYIVSYNTQNFLGHNYDATIKIWNGQNGELIRIIHNEPPHNARNNNIFSAEFSHNSLYLVTAHGKTIKVWNVETGQHLYTSDARGVNSDDIIHASFSPQDTFIVGFGNSHYKVWDFKAILTNGARKQLNSNNARLQKDSRTIFSYDDSKIISFFGNDVTIRNARTGRLVHTLQGQRASVECAEFSPNGKYIMTADDEGAITFWDAQTYHEINSKEPIKISDDFFKIVNFSPDSNFIVALLHNSEEVKIWDIKTGELKETINEALIKSVEISPDGLQILFLTNSEYPGMDNQVFVSDFATKIDAIRKKYWLAMKKPSQRDVATKIARGKSFA